MIPAKNIEFEKIFNLYRKKNFLKPKVNVKDLLQRIKITFSQINC